MTHAERQAAYRRRQQEARAEEQARLAQLQTQDALVRDLHSAVMDAFNAGRMPAREAVELAWRADADLRRQRALPRDACLRCLAAWFRPR